MKLFSGFKAFINKPYPDIEDRLTYLKLLICFSLFIAFFLYIFEPFGIADIESNKLWICVGFGSMTFIGVLLYELTVGILIAKLGFKKHWTFGKWMLNNLGIMIFISLANFIFIRKLLFGHLDWSLFPTMIYGTFMVGIIPLGVLGAFGLLAKEKKYKEIAEQINQKDHSKSEREEYDDITLYDIPIMKVKYVEALQNYIKIGYVSADNTISEKTERATIKQVLEQTAGSSIVRSHRSYLVNKEAIVSSTGNAQGLMLTLSDCEKQIPVSRSNVGLFK